MLCESWLGILRKASFNWGIANAKPPFGVEKSLENDHCRGGDPG